MPFFYLDEILEGGYASGYAKSLVGLCFSLIFHMLNMACKIKICVPLDGYDDFFY